MDPQVGRARAAAAREAARRVTVVGAMLREVAEKGFVPLERDAVDYVPPGDPRIRELVNGGSDWARYTARLEDGALYQEGGARRTLWVAPAQATRRLREKASALPRLVPLFTLLETYVQARGTRGEGLTVVAALWAAADLRAALEARIVERAAAEEESGRIHQARHLEILADLGVDEETLRRLRGTRTLPDSVLERVAERRRPAPDAALAEALAAAPAGARVVLRAPDAPYVGRDDPAAVQVIDGEGSWWRYAVLLAGGDLHLEGGSRRERHTSAAHAEALVRVRVEALVASRDLRVLLYTRGRLEKPAHRPSAEDRIARDEALRARLDGAIRALTAGASPEPPLGEPHLAPLRAAGVEDATIRRLTGDRGLPEEARAAMGAAARAADEERRAEAGQLEALVDERLAAGFVWLGEDAVPYVGHDDPTAQAVFRAVPDWCTHAVALADGSLHFEGGVRRRRLVPADRIDPLLRAAAKALVASAELPLLLDVAARMGQPQGQPTVAGLFGRDAKLRAALTKRVTALSAGPAFDGRIRRPAHLRVLEALGFDEATRRRLAGDRKLPEAVLAEQARRVSEALRKAPADDLLAQIDDLLAEGWVELLEDTVSFLPLDAPGIARVEPALLPWTRHVAWLENGDIHLEGGRRRIRVTTKGRADAALATRAEELIGSDDLFELLDTVVRARAGTPHLSPYRTIQLSKPRMERLVQRVGEVALLARFDGRLVRRAHRAILAEAGISEERIATLFGETWVDPASLEAQRANAKAAREAKDEGAARLGALIAQREAEGQLCLAEDAADYVGTDDPRVEVLLEGAPDWCTHAALLADGSLHLEGGVRRLRWVAPKTATALLRAAAARVLASRDLFDVLDVAERVRRAHRPQSVAGVFADDGALLAALGARLLELAREPRYAGRVRRESHLQILRELGLDTVQARALQGARTVPEEVVREARARVAAVRAKGLADALLAEMDDRLAEGAVELFEDTLPFLAADAAGVERVVPGLLPWTRHVAWLDDGDIHLEGGRRRVRVTSRIRAEQLVARRVDQLLMGDDLFELLETWQRARIGIRHLSPYRTIGEQKRLLEALERRVLQVAQRAEWDGRVTRRPQRAILRELGLEPDRLAALTGEVWIDPASEAARREAGRAARQAREEGPARLAALIEERESAGWLCLAEDTADYVGTDDPRVETLVDGAPDWCTHAALLSDGSVHLEGAVRRARWVAPERALELVGAAADRLLVEADLFTLLDVAARMARRHESPTVAALFAEDAPRRVALVERIRALVVEPRYAGRVRRASHTKILAALGVPTEELRALEGTKTLPEEVLAEVHARAAAGRQKSAAELLLEEIDDRLAEGAIEVYEDTVPFLAPDAVGIERVVPALLPWTRHVAWLASGDIHLEGGRRRVRVTSRKRGEQLARERADELVASQDLFELLDTYQRAQVGTPYLSPYQILTRPEKLEALTLAIAKVAESPAWDGKVTRRRHLVLLEKLGVSPERRAALAGETYVDPSGEAARAAASRAARQARQDAGARLDALIQERESNGFLCIAEDAADYVGTGDPRVETLLEGAPDWCTHAALLVGGALHLEGGVRRRRWISSEEAGTLVGQAADARIDGGDLFVLLDLAAGMARRPEGPTVAALLAEDPARRERLVARIGALVTDPRYAGRIRRPAHRKVLRALGIAEDVLAVLEGARRLPPDLLPPTSTASGAAEDDSPESLVARRLAELFADGGVVLPAEAVEAIAPEDPRVRLRLDTPDGAFLYTLLLEDGSVHQEGADTRARIVPREAAPAALRDALDRLLATGNPGALVALAVAAERPGASGVAGLVAADSTLLERLNARIRAQGADVPEGLDDECGAYLARLLADAPTAEPVD